MIDSSLIPMSRIWANIHQVENSPFSSSYNIYFFCVLHLSSPSPNFSPMAPAVGTSSLRAGYKLAHHFQARVALSGDTIKQTRRKSHRNKRMFQKSFLCMFFFYFPPLSIFSSTLTFYFFSTIKHKGWSKIGRHMKGNNNIPFIRLQKSLSSIYGVIKLRISPAVF